MSIVIALTAIFAPSATVYASGYCTDTTFSGTDALAKLNAIQQPEWGGVAVLTFDPACKPSLEIAPDFGVDPPTGGAVLAVIDNPDPFNPRWTITKTASDTWTAKLKTQGAHAMVVVGGNFVQMKVGSVVTFKVTAADTLWFKAAGVATTGQNFEAQTKTAGWAPVAP